MLNADGALFRRLFLSGPIRKKGRVYYVRDNGAVYRRCQDDGKIRKWDEEWTFGKLDQNSGYMLIGQERVHRIVCKAYHGEPVGDRNVADHIDTNRCNNRPENLRCTMRLWQKTEAIFQY